MSDALITVVELPTFIRRADKLLSATERAELITFLSMNPLAGDEVPGTGGVRKVRFAAQGKGKSGGVRVIYYVFDENNPLYALLIYGKGEQANLTPDQKNAATQFAAIVKAEAKAKRNVQ